VTDKENKINSTSIRANSMSAIACSQLEKQNMKLFDKQNLSNPSTKLSVIKTVNDLQKNILYYGLSRKEV
jgi:hypothetical protein